MGKLFHAGMFLAALVTPLGSTMIAVALPGIGRELGVEARALNLWLVMSYLVVSVVGQAPGGWLGDRISQGGALLVGVLSVALGSLVGCVVSSVSGLAVARVLMAAGGALTIPAVMALLRTRTPERGRARAFGVFGAVLGLAAAIGPLIGGKLVATIGWRAVFLVNLPILAVATVLVRRPAWRDRVARRRERALGEHAAGAPLLDLRLFRERAFAAGAAVIALHNLTMYALLFQLPVALAHVKGVGPEETGRILLGMLGGLVVGSPIGGRLAERLGPRSMTLAGSLTALVGLALVPSLGPLVRASALVPGHFVLGLGLGLASAPAQSAAMSAACARTAGRAAGVLSTARYLGGLAGIALISGAAQAPPASVLPRAYALALAASVLAAFAIPGRHRSSSAAASDLEAEAA